MHIHILGICGTFMGSLARIAQAAGHRVTGVDAAIYPPMSELLAEADIEMTLGYDSELPSPRPDLVLIGNALSRGNPTVEAILAEGIPYDSGPAWLTRELLAGRWVLAVAGTHGKTTTTAMLAWILEHAGLAPGFLIGGAPKNFSESGRLGQGPFFVIEADEYDTAFFDKRAKFVHYRPRTVVLNHLEYDHADIYPDLAAIETQFHYLLRTVPGNGQVIYRDGLPALQRVLERGCWSEAIPFAGKGRWTVELEDPAGSAWRVYEDGQLQGRVEWSLYGGFNAENGLAAILAARHAGVPVAISCAALSQFAGVRRRLEERGKVAGIRVYDDFAHHPTAIAATLQALRAREPQGRVLAVLEPRSNTMRLGVHRDELKASLDAADAFFAYAPPDLSWDLAAALGHPEHVFTDLDALVHAVVDVARPGDHLLVMSNGAFGGVHERLLRALEQKQMGQGMSDGR
ncbi:MAG: UDP-N-acetylmuramate:L-alanyl-gamma-D-glutamyl-meso-diaminopimelate ligase [Acidithiobacillus sp.]|uniref:UDP-N-acetylmuramate:L-alanyl-gamma-D-glutamyl- meso-diaminopimelate ligase n=1 Tax=Acidithiobacillus sp. TaxID=1872118 RepID=UPI003D0915F4